jgi:serine/threonine protein kinase
VADDEKKVNFKQILMGIRRTFEKQENSLMKLGVIVMELAEHYKPLSHFIPIKGSPNYAYELKRYNVYELYALFELYRLHKLGYVHRDFHRANVMINPKSFYFDHPRYQENRIKKFNMYGKAIILDFGKTKRYEYCELAEGVYNDNFDELTIENMIDMEILNTSSRRMPLIKNGETIIADPAFRESVVIENAFLFSSYQWLEKHSYNMDMEGFDRTIRRFNETLFPKRNRMIEIFRRQTLDLFPDLMDPMSRDNLKILLSPSRSPGPPIHLDPNRQRMTSRLSTIMEGDTESESPTKSRAPTPLNFPMEDLFQEPLKRIPSMKNTESLLAIPEAIKEEPPQMVDHFLLPQPMKEESPKERDFIEQIILNMSKRNVGQKEYSLFGGREKIRAVAPIKELEKIDISKKNAKSVEDEELDVANETDQPVLHELENISSADFLRRIRESISPEDITMSLSKMEFNSEKKNGTKRRRPTVYKSLKIYNDK